MIASRIEVYDAIDTERKYQDIIWGEHQNNIHNPSSFILWMEEYLSKARGLVSKVDETPGAGSCYEVMDIIRKVTALGVACMEFNGAPNR